MFKYEEIIKAALEVFNKEHEGVKVSFLFCSPEIRDAIIEFYDYDDFDDIYHSGAEVCESPQLREIDLYFI